MCTPRGGAQVESLAGILPDIFVFCVLPGLFLRSCLCPPRLRSVISVRHFTSLVESGSFLTQTDHILCCVLPLSSLWYVSHCPLPPPIAV